MRLKLGRPVLEDFAKRFDVPPADAGTPLAVTWLGVATLLISDGESARGQPTGANIARHPSSPAVGESFTL